MASPAYSVVSRVPSVVKANSSFPVWSSCIGRLVKERPVNTHNWALGPGLSLRSPPVGRRNIHDATYGQRPGGRMKSDRPPFEAYPYDTRPLTSGKSTRLLMLYPGATDDEIKTSLKVCDFEKNHYDYEALSYVWDDLWTTTCSPDGKGRYSMRDIDGKLCCAIECDGHTIGVTPNLYLAFRRLRLPTKVRLLWVDKFSIDQANNLEKSQQAALTSMVIANAQRVILWMGEEDSLAYGAVIALARWAQLWKNTNAVYQPELLERIYSGGNFAVERRCFLALIRRLWFTKGWTFSELCLSRDAELVCGRHRVPWADFRAACAAVVSSGLEKNVFEENQIVQTLCEYSDLTKKLPSPESRALDERFQLSSLIMRTNSQRAYDPRDKIYSLIGLANSSIGKTTVKADYSLSVPDTYRIFTRAMIEEEGDFGILSNVQRPRIDGFLEKRASIHKIIPFHGLPSWVPDYHYKDVVESTTDRINLDKTFGYPNRTRFPQIIAQEYEGLPMYRPSNDFSSRVVNGNFTFDAGDEGELGVYGKLVGEVRATFSMLSTNDPWLRTSLAYLKEDPGAYPKAGVWMQNRQSKVPFNLDFRKRFKRLDLGLMLKPDPVLEQERYGPTGESTAMAVLRTLTADRLPISPRVPDSYKLAQFPMHYDWYLWNDPKEMLRTILILSVFAFPVAPPLIFGFLAHRCVRLFEASRSLRRRNKTDPLKPASLFDTSRPPLRWPRKLRSVYENVLLDPKTSLANVGTTSTKRNNSCDGNNFPLHPIPRKQILAALAISCASIPLLVYSGIAIPTLLALWKYAALASLAPAAVFAALSYRTRGMRHTRFANTIPAGWIKYVKHADKNRFFGVACEIQQAVNRMSWNRVFFVTKEGQMGIGPVGTRVGDRVVALVGGPGVYVVRREVGAEKVKGEQGLVKKVYVGEGRGDAGRNKNRKEVKMGKGKEELVKFRLWGEAYVHGFMDGEAWGQETWGETDREALERMKMRATRMVLV